MVELNDVLSLLLPNVRNTAKDVLTVGLLKRWLLDGRLYELRL